MMTSSNRMDERLKELALSLFEAEALKFGDFLTKSGIRSPVYFDLRVIISYPHILENVSKLLSEYLGDIKCDHLCGVPYTALPIATVMSVQNNIPMVMRRKETKDYGTKKKIEGKFKEGASCVIIEDVITSGSSILETVTDLNFEGLKVDHALIILDRQQGGLENLRAKGICVKSLFTLTSFLDILLSAGKIDNGIYKGVQEYLISSKIIPTISQKERFKMRFQERADFTKNHLAKRLFNLMELKKTNLCVAADLTQSREILQLFEKVGPYVCMLKLHTDIISDFTMDFVQELKMLADKHSVILMEDRKFSDIGNTAYLQCSGGIFKINSWADVVTVHTLAGVGMLKGVKKAFNKELGGVFVVAEMSSEENLITPSYTSSSMKIVSDQIDMVTGIVCQNRNVFDDPSLIQLTPGVKLQKSGDDLGQAYNTPRDIIIEKGADIAVVGRGIIEASDVVSAAQEYRDILWRCYEERVN